MKSWTAILVVFSVLAVATAARADDGKGPVRVRVGFKGVVMAGDRRNPEGPGMSLGGSPTFDLVIGRYFFVGLGPQASVKLESESYSRTMVVLDLLLRVGGIVPLGERFQLYGYLAPGYSALFRETRTHYIPTVGGYGGGAVRVADGVFATVQLGHQIAWILDSGDSVVFLRRPSLAVGLLMAL